MATDDKDKKEEMMPNSNFGSMSLYNSDLWKRAKERIDAMPEGKEKERAKFLLAQDYAGLKDILGADVASSEAMLNEQMPEGRQAGSVYVAANPLEFLSSALRQGIGAKGRRNSMDALRQLSADQAEARGNIQFPGDGGGQARSQGRHDMPVAEFAAAQADAGVNKPTLNSLTSQRPGLNQGLSEITQQAMTPEAQVGRAMERRGEQRQQGKTPPPVGQGVAGQAKQAASLRGNHNMPIAGLAAAEPQPSFGVGIRPDQLTEQKQSLADMVMTGNSDPSIASQRRTQFNADNNTDEILFDLMNRRNRRY